MRFHKPSYLVKTLFRALGLEVAREVNALTENNVLKDVFRLIRPDLVIDVGANTGQYVELLRSLNFAGQVVSIEPLSAAHERLVRRAALSSNWIVAPRMLLGAQAGVGRIHVSLNSVSSSTKQMLSLHEVAAPHSKTVSSETVQILTGNEMLTQLGLAPTNTYLKVDTQGAELEVLTGFGASLSECVGIQVELSLQPLYLDQPKVSQIINLLAQYGFELTHIIPGFRDPHSHRLLQMDGVFLKRPPVATAIAA
jgi:FkbM family methyltransferase